MDNLDTPAETLPKAKRQSPMFLVHAPDGTGTPVLTECASRRDAAKVVAAVGADKVIGLYKAFKLSVKVKTETKTHISF